MDAIDAPAGKWCCRCRARKPLAAFHGDASKPDGRKYACAACVNAARRLPGGPGPRRPLPDEGPRRCRACRAVLPARAFEQLRTGRRRGVCLACRREQANARRRAARAAARAALAAAA